MRRTHTGSDKASSSSIGKKSDKGILDTPVVVSQFIQDARKSRESNNRALVEARSVEIEKEKGHTVPDQVTRSALPKQDFPKKEGTDPDEWVIQCNHYFSLCPVPDTNKTHMVVLQFSGKASSWYRG